MAKVLTLTIPNGSSEIVLYSDMYVENWRSVECFHKNLGPAESYITCSIPYNLNIANNLLSHGDEDIKAVITEGSNTIFSGYLRKTFKISKTQQNKPISLELRSPAFFLDKEIGTNVCLESKSFLYVINYILKSINFYTTDKTATDLSDDADIRNKLAETLDVIVLSETDNVNTIIKNICFELGTVYNFDNFGNLKLFPLFNDYSNNHVFSENNMYKAVEVSKKELEADSINLKWNEKKYIENALIFADTQGGDTDTSCKITIPAGEYLYGQEINKCEYDCDQGAVIWAKSATAVIDGIPKTYETVNKGTYLQIKYLNNSSEDKTITKFNVSGDAWIQVEGENSTKSVNGKKTKDYTIRYLNDQDSIETLAENLAKYYKYQDFTVKVYSHDDVSIGSFAAVTAEGIGTIQAKVIKKITFATKSCYEYELEAVKEYDTIVIETKKQKSSSPYINLQNQINEVNRLVDEVESNYLLMLYKRAPQKPEETGISGTGYYNFQTGVLTWDEEADSNGWNQIQNLEAGTDPIYITTVYLTGKETVSIEDSRWSEPVLYVKNGENGENSSSAYYIIANHNIITRYKDGKLSASVVSFRFFQGNESSRGAVDCYFVLTKQNKNGNWEQVRTGVSSSTSFEITDEVGLHIDIYASAADEVPLDSQTVGIVNEGQDSITVVLSNPTSFVAVNSEGEDVDYSDTETNLYVMSGANYLNYGEAEIPGCFDYDVIYENCTAVNSRSIEYGGYITDENDEPYIDENDDPYMTNGSFTLPQLTAMTAESAARIINVWGTSLDGSSFSFEVKQTFKKIHYGNDGKNVSLKSIKYGVSTSSDIVPTSWSDTMPSEVAQGAYLWIQKIYVNESTGEESAEYTYNYKPYDGERGLQGLQGEKGEQGIPGTNGNTSYFHIKYSHVANPTDAQMTETPSEYIGTYVDFEPTDSTSASKYTWSKFVGAQGEKGDQGIPGINGEDGQTSYLHIAYANSADGRVDFSVADSTNKSYIGQYTDFKSQDSTDPTKYKWTEIKGQQGNDGDDGTGGMAIFLYKRATSQPALPTAELTFKLANPPVLTWGTGTSNGWTYEKPAVVADKLPLWQISATATFAGDVVTDKIKASEWHLDGIVQLDNGLTEDETQEIIDESIEEYNKNIPVFSYSADSYNYVTGSDGITQKTQYIKISLSCIRNKIPVDFEIKEVTCPDTLVYIISNKDIFFTAKAGTVLNAGQIQIKVKLSEENYKNYLKDENNSNYLDEKNEAYYETVFYNDAIIQQTIEIPFGVIRGERNLGAIKSESKIPAEPLIGDFFVWMSASIDSKKSSSGSFKLSSVYQFNGELWDKDEDTGHISRVMDQVLAVSEEDLKRNNETLYENNSWAYTWLNHLSTNTAFIGTLVSDQAFIDKLSSNEGFIKKFMSHEIKVGYIDDQGIKHDGTLESLNYDKSKGEGYRIAPDEVDFPSGRFRGTIIADSLDIGSNTININNVKDLDESLENSSNDAIDKTLEQLVGEDNVDKNNHTIIENGKITTDLIDVEGIFTEKIEMKKNSSNEYGYIKTEGFESGVDADKGFMLDGELGSIECNHLEARNLNINGLAKIKHGLEYGSNIKIEYKNQNIDTLFEQLSDAFKFDELAKTQKSHYFNAAVNLYIKITHPEYGESISSINANCIRIGYDLLIKRINSIRFRGLYMLFENREIVLSEVKCVYDIGFSKIGNTYFLYEGYINPDGEGNAKGQHSLDGFTVSISGYINI